MMRQVTRHSLWSIVITIMSVVVIAAQGASCTGLLEDALFAVEDNCEGTGRNQVCYGFNQVSASFVDEVSADFFTQPSDVSEIVDLATIQTAALDVANDIWGVALMNIQANLPNTLPGQSVTFVLLGDVEVGNTVDPDNAFQPSDGIEIVVTSAAGANIRSGAGLNFNVLGGARPDEVLIADGTSADGQWLRIAYTDRVAWISRTVIDDTAEGLDELPVLSNQLQTPMQSFYLRTGIGQPECEEVPDDVLLVQGPENIEVDITVNGVDIHIGSTLALRFVEGEDGQIYMQVIAISGNIEVDGVNLLPGQFTQFIVEEDENGLPIAVGDPSPPAPFEGYVDEYCLLESLPLSLLNYQITTTCTNPLIAPIVNTGGGSAITSTTSQVQGANCNSFALLSPLSPVNSGIQTFRWAAVQGANIDYVVVFYNNDGIEVNQFRTAATELTLNLGQDTNTGGAFTWEVRAYQNITDYACVTFRSPNLVRTGELNPPVVPVVESSSLSATLTSCISVDGVDATISWSNASTGNVTISWVDGYANPDSAIFAGASGATTISDYAGFLSIQVQSGSDVVNLGDCEPYYYYPG